MSRSAKTVTTIFWTALLIRFLSQFVWEMYPTINLSFEEFIYGLVLAPFIWIKLELAKLLTCLAVAIAFYAFAGWTSEKANLTSYSAFLVKTLVLIIISCFHAYFWIVVDCQFIYNGTRQEGECLRLLLSPPEASQWFST